MNAESPTSPVLRPTRRWKTRVLLPSIGVGAALALFGYSARDAMMPALAVEVAPVIVAGVEEARSGGGVAAQATGWIEPEPFPIPVAARRAGLIEELLVLEGDEVEAGQIVARLLDEDERNALREAEAQLMKTEAELSEVEVELDARRAALRRELISPVEVKRLESRLRVRQAEVEMANARRDKAALAVARSEVVSPISGVVLSRLAEAGSRVGAADAHGGGAIVTLYSPSRLQVRVDVPLARAGRIGLGNEAEIVAEVLPDRVFRGEVSRVMQEADISRNTLQFKVTIDQPARELKPEMTARVRILEPAGAEENEGGPQRVFAPVQVVGGEPGDRVAWIADQNDRAVRREITVGERRKEAWIEVLAGLKPGDRLIVDPPSGLSEGRRLRLPESGPRGNDRTTWRTESR